MQKMKILIKSFLSLFAIMHISSMSTKNPLSLLLFIVFIYVFSKLHTPKAEGNIGVIDPYIAGVVSGLFSIFTISAKYHTILGGLENKLFCLVILLLSFLGFLTIYYYLMIWLLQICEHINIQGNYYAPLWIPIATVFICMLCWLPYFLYEYPGVMTPDSINQYAQIIGAYELSNHHSVVHTMMISFFYNIGLNISGNATFGIALYTLFQIILMAVTTGMVIRTLQCACVKNIIIIVAIVFYAITPYNAILAVTVWKDIPFSCFLTIFVASLIRLLIRPGVTGPTSVNTRLKPFEYFTIIIPYIISGIMISLLRTNGWYAFCISLPFILWVYRAAWKALVPMNICILVIVIFVKVPLMNIYEIKQADFAESISIPAQQLARVVVDGGRLNEAQLEYLNKIMDVSKITKVYQPDVSDNIKNLIRQTGLDYLESNKSEFFKNWLSIGINNKKSYFDAFVDQTNGYWYPDIEYEVGLADGIYDNEFGLSWQPVIAGNAMVKIREILFKLSEMIPLYGLLWSIGGIFWLIIVTCALCIRKGQIANMITALPLIALMLTLCIASPVAGEFRYAYALFYSLPLTLVIPFINPQKW
ncbi:MAG: DUF6020 family protein [Lachnospiraceae bacterium]|nr:DUF6020 family protein [Lachnospiraceae bacterium]